MRRTGFNILFQSTLPAGGATSLEDYFGLPTGVFQSTLPAGGATKNHQNQEYEIQISIHAPRRGSDFVPYRLLWRHWISIHAPRRGSDRRQECKYHSLQDFNPRSPQGERRKRRFLTRQKPVFQSTLPAGGATLLPGSGWEVEAISIHAPRRGSDKRESAYILKDVGFQSTLPAGGATYAVAPSDEPDGDFNPRSPQGERRWRWLLNSQFRSISIHAPRRGSDP